MILRKFIYLAVCYLIVGCVSPGVNKEKVSLANTGNLPTPNLTLSIPSLRSCTNSGEKQFSVNTAEPIIIIVHGCFSSAGRFTALADVFAFHGQQAICFDYDDRDSLDTSAAQLIQSLEQLSAKMDNPSITVIGHSQGGLVARRALTGENKRALKLTSSRINLATISGPFGGIEAASHCGSNLLAWLSLGLTKPICKIVTGNKYREIPPNSNFINQPGTLLAIVDRHIKIDTDEKNTCRRFSADNKCLEDDYVFSLNEQKNTIVESESRLSPVIVKAGHAEIVGDQQIIPHKLISILQDKGILHPTRAEDLNALNDLLKDLYVRAN